MPSEVVLHIGENGEHEDGDILYVSFTFDAQRVIAETISNGRHSAVRDLGHIATLRSFYTGITDPNKQPQPTKANLSLWWDECERITGLNRRDFSNFPYTSGEKRLFLVVSLSEEATQDNRAEWTGKIAGRERGSPLIPKIIDWQEDIMPGLRVRRDRRGDNVATVADVQNKTKLIRVLDPVSASVIKDRA